MIARIERTRAQDHVTMPASSCHQLLLSCDWGTTTFRLRLVDTETRRVVHQSSSQEGNAAVFAGWRETSGDQSRWDFYLQVIRRHLTLFERSRGASLAGVPLVVSGMATSSVGMRELPYADMPFATDGSSLRVEFEPATATLPHEVLLISGVCTAHDVMRGEETQLVGATIDRSPEANEGVFIFPGTHSKHVVVRAGRAVDFATHMTGEFFDLLSRRSLLAQSVQSSGELDLREHLDSFVQGVRDGARGELLRDCFRVRSRSLLHQISPAASWHRLSGLLIGAELGTLDETVAAATIVGSGVLAEAYAHALRVLWPTMQIRVEDADACLVRGQHRIAADRGLFRGA